MATFLGLCQDVRAQAGISGDGPTNVTGQTGIYADVVRWVEEAYNEIQTLHDDWNFLFKSSYFTLQTGFDEYDVSAENIRTFTTSQFLRQYQLGDKSRMQFIPYQSWMNVDKFLNVETGKPEYLTELPSGNLKFWKKADDDYEIYYQGYTVPDIMTASTDTPIFPAQYHELIKFKALERYAEYYNAMEIYQTVSRAYKEGIKRMEYSELPKRNLVTIPFV